MFFYRLCRLFYRNFIFYEIIFNSFLNLCIKKIYVYENFIFLLCRKKKIIMTFDDFFEYNFQEVIKKYFFKINIIVLKFSNTYIYKKYYYFIAHYLYRL